ncbi:uncharacterized protein J3D65DRAFT_604910 [Phyllosticta citribraziliensis]|uniref:Uncharacterized protein n=1 Tax=Phyllosticta citribraziliensis TaxID=989973 RepID=A0ABR1LF71_9PEZI
MSPGIHRGFRSIPALFGHGRCSRPQAKDDHNYGQKKHKSSLSRHKNGDQKPFSLSDQVKYAAREMVQLRIWQDYGCYIGSGHWNQQREEEVTATKHQLIQVACTASDRGYDWRVISEELGQEQKTLEMLKSQEIPVSSRRLKEEFPLMAAIEDGLMRTFGRHGLKRDEWIWELHEYVRRQMVRSFSPHYNFFEELARRKDWIAMGDSLTRDLSRLEDLWSCNESIILHKMRAALINCASYFFLEFPRMSDDGVKHFYPRRDWLDDPSPPQIPTLPPAPEEALDAIARDEKTLRSVINECTSDKVCHLGEKAARTRRARPQSCVL